MFRVTPGVFQESTISSLAPTHFASIFLVAFEDVFLMPIPVDMI